MSWLKTFCQLIWSDPRDLLIYDKPVVGYLTDGTAVTGVWRRAPRRLSSVPLASGKSFLVTSIHNYESTGRIIDYEW